MEQLYRHTHMTWSQQTAESSLGELLRSREKGGAWLIRIDGAAAGYFILTLAFSLEFGGTFALLDELYVQPKSRGQGIGSATLRFVEVQCRELGAATLRLETGFDNPDAVRFYERHGLTREQRHLMTKRLS
jgi:GNAT superfamily N-acetyltransferase